ncbi:hypothetical protein [Dactylosporangium sp. NPDC000521]|uniref:hypothetical protein n=1 Tax=Dactylosporangium sp. NPDC000521 TaxID=3363975 RepID=UPI0036ABB37A
MTARLLRLELRRNAMVWMLPLLGALFWLVAFRRSVAYPPLWNIRATSMQTAAVSVFAPSVVGVAAWIGSREGRHGMTGLLSSTARPRWARQAVAWAATTCWALLAYLVCVGVLYGVTAAQGAWGGPLWWPATVGAASLPAFAAAGFAAGALRPSRLTAPVAAVGVFLALQLTVQLIHGDRSHWQISPLVANPWNLGADQGVATFYPYLPDLPIAQLLFLAGWTAALLGLLGLPAGSGRPWLRRSAAAVTAAGLLAAGTAAALAGTARIDPHGMVAIPVLHDAADDRPVPYTPICGGTPVPVCLHPAYAVYLPAVTEALAPVLGAVAGLPGAPVRVTQAATTYRSGSGGIGVARAGEAWGRTPPEYRLLLPSQLPGRTLTLDEVAAAVRADAGHDIVASVIGAARDATPAQDAVVAALLGTPAAVTDPDAAAAARRLAALPLEARRAWLAGHLDALRAGTLTVEQLP